MRPPSANLMCVSVQIASHADLMKGSAVKCKGPKYLIKRKASWTQQNPKEPGKSTNPGQQGGQQQDREREERERQQRERERQGGGQRGGGQQGGR